MLIVCPSCASEYMIDPGRLGAEGRTVRCASCKTTWFATPEPEEPADASPDAKAPEPAPEVEATGAWDEPFLEGEDADQPTGDAEVWMQAAHPADRDSTRPSLGFAPRIRQFAAGPLLILTGIILAGSAFWGRTHIVRTVPATAALYASIGLPVNLRGLEFRAVRSELVSAGADTVLVVEGEIANISGRDAPVPPIEIGVRGAEGQMLYTWTNEPPRPTLATSDTAHFRARLAAPPVEGRQVLVRFAAGRDGTTMASHTR